MQNQGILIHLAGDNPILAYKEFTVNDSNYVFLNGNRRVSANMNMNAADGMGLQVYTDDSNAEALQDITVSTHQLNLGEALSIIPYMPNVSGILNGDFHLIQTPEQLSVSSVVDVKDMVYEGCEMGDVGSEFTYMPRPDGTHYVDGMLTHDGNEVGTLTAPTTQPDTGTSTQRLIPTTCRWRWSTDSSRRRSWDSRVRPTAT